MQQVATPPPPPPPPISPKKTAWRPPFDFYGMKPSFYLNGKDRTVSCIGFFCSIVLAGSLIAVSVLYGLSFVKNKTQTVYTSLLSATNAPVIDLKEKKFLIAFRSHYPDDKPFHGLQEKFFKIKFYRTDESPINDIDWNRVEAPAVPCTEIKMDLTEVNHSQKDLEGAYCMEFTVETAPIGGSFEVDAVYTLEVFIDPCEVTAPGDCEVIWNGVPTSTIDEVGPISSYFEDFSL